MSKDVAWIQGMQQLQEQAQHFDLLRDQVTFWNPKED